MSRQHFLWIVPKWPLPAQDGARVATVRLIEALTRRGHRVDLLAVHGREESADAEEVRTKLGVDRVFSVPRPGAEDGKLSRVCGTLSSLLRRPSVPLTFRNYAHPKVADAIESTLRASEGWDAIVYDGLHPAAHRGVGGTYRRPDGGPAILYRAHNVESEIWRRKAARTRFLPFRFFLEYQARLIHRFERSLCSVSDGVAFVSSSDEASLAPPNETQASGRSAVVPIGADFGAEPAPIAAGPELEILFVGRLDWRPNLEGLEWFLDEVWPGAFAARPELRLSIVGSGKTARSAEWAALPGVRFLGRVEELEPLYRASALTIAPIFYGSGTRVKIIESSRFGRACLSTEIGAEGTGLVAGESFFRAETAEDWTAFLRRFDRREAETVGRTAYLRLKREFGIDRTAEKFEGLAERARLERSGTR